MTETEFDKALAKIPRYILDCPIAMQWVKFKGETFFAILNYERSLSARKPMIDLFFCATRAMNDLVIKTVQYDKKNFKMWKIH